MSIAVTLNGLRGFCLLLDVAMPIDCFIFHPGKARQSTCLRQDGVGRVDTFDASKEQYAANS